MAASGLAGAPRAAAAEGAQGRSGTKRLVRRAARVVRRAPGRQLDRRRPERLRVRPLKGGRIRAEEALEEGRGRALTFEFFHAEGFAVGARDGADAVVQRAAGGVVADAAAGDGGLRGVVGWWVCGRWLRALGDGPPGVPRRRPRDAAERLLRREERRFESRKARVGAGRGLSEPRGRRRGRRVLRVLRGPVRRARARRFATGRRGLRVLRCEIQRLAAGELWVCGERQPA
mmetsp:Transcript_24363/g.68537  ORF Transcript_24363/g.68537 Transcript_24363/m.68537 type:complete len:231 (+) Transcript_24363:453-1145(+)